MTLVIPRERLPLSEAERHARLRDYFCDKDALAVLGPGGWTLSLAWNGDEHRHVDPQLRTGLAWWGEGVTPDGMAHAMKRSGRTLRALYDTWTLFSWSEWLARRGDEAVGRLTILHVDDHRDLGAPRLFVEGARWSDPIAGGVCDLAIPESVEAAIRSGALGMGSFLTPFLHRFPDAEVRHLCQPPKSRSTADFRIRLTQDLDDLLDPGASRPAICLDPASGMLGPGSYRQTPHLDDWLEDIGDGPILLHIDMDYFSNRYDGDSAWRDRPEPPDLSLAEVCDKIDEMTAALQERGLTARLEDIVVAFSPGFFPAEFWEAADARLARGLGHG